MAAAEAWRLSRVLDSRVGMLSKLFQYFQGLSAIQQYYEAKNGIVKQATEYAQLQGFTSYPHMPTS